MKHKLITLGCSLTWDIGVKEKLSTLTDRTLISLAQTAGSNGLQINKFHEYVLQNEVDTNDIILWQITSPTRNAVRLYPSSENRKLVYDIQKNDFTPIDRYHFIENSFNSFDRLQRLDMLCNSPLSLVEFDQNEQLQNVLTNIILCSKVYPKTLIVFGWKEMFKSDEMYTFKKYFDKHKVNYIPYYYTNWVRDNGYGFWDDNKHPDTNAGEQWATKILYPKLVELGYL